MMTIKEQTTARAEACVLPMIDAWCALGTNGESAANIAAFIGAVYRGGICALPAPAVIGTAADALAIDLGYTRRVEIEGGCQCGEFLIRADEDLDSCFKAWGTDWQEWTWVHGCNVLIAECDA